MRLFFFLMQNDTILNKIAEASTRTALNTTLNSFDWVSFAVALIALVVAFVTLYYTIVTLNVTKKTLVSQERTERNTRKISFESQSDLLSALLSDIFYRFADICAIHIYLEQHNYTCYPNEKYFNDLKLSLTYIQENSDVRENNDIYIDLAMLKERVSDYNDMLRTYSDTISNSEAPQEIREGSITSMLMDLKEIAETTSKLFVKYYSNTIGDNINRIISLATADFNDVPTFPIVHNLLISGNSVLNTFGSYYVESIIDGRTYYYKDEIVSKDDLMCHLGKVTACRLKYIQNWFYDFDLDLSERFISNWSGLLLPIPSISKKHKYNYGGIELNFFENELRLYSHRIRLNGPMLTYFDGEEPKSIEFHAVKDDKQINTLYYRIVFDTEDDLQTSVLSSNDVIIKYHPVRVPSIVMAEMGDVERLYETVIPNREFNMLYAARVTKEKFVVNDQIIDRFIDKVNVRESSDNVEEIAKEGDNGASTGGDYEVMMNDDGEILFIINKRGGLPKDSRFILDHSGNALLYRSKESSVIFYDLADSAYDAILKVESLIVAEIDGEEVVRKYYVPVIVIKSIESLLS